MQGDGNENKIWKGEKVHGNNDTTKKLNLKCKCKKLDGDNYTKKNSKIKTLKP